VTLEIGLLFAVLAVMVYLFLTEKLPVDLTAFLGLVFLIFAGYVEPGEAFQGFASSAVITMLSVFIVSAALLNTGLADMIARRLHAVIGGREIPLVVSLMLIAGVLSAFMNNIAATAVLMPAVAALAARARISPSRLFMPLAFGAILGGTTTLVGTPPNILAGEMLRERGLEPFALFDFTPLGMLMLGLGTLFMITAGRHLLPVREPAEHSPGAGGGDLAQLYQVQDKLFTLRLAADSALDGQSLSETRLGRALGSRCWRSGADANGCGRAATRRSTAATCCCSRAGSKRCASCCGCATSRCSAPPSTTCRSRGPASAACARACAGIRLWSVRACARSPSASATGWWWWRSAAAGG
jgi:hypothetical protein